MGKKKTILEEKELRALGIPFPDELDRCFRHPSDPADDYASAYMRAVDFAAELGDTLAAHLWQQALEIGLRAGRGNVDAVTSDAREEGMRKGREMGLSDGLKEGLGEGKRLGFVAGRNFGEKQAAKLSNTPVPEHVLVDVGTDSLVVELNPSLPPSSSPVDASTQTDTLPATVTPLTALSLPFTWADEADTPDPTPGSPRMPRDFSALRSDSASLTPFSTLQYRVRRKQKSARASRPSAFPSTSRRQYPTSATPIRRAAAASFASKSFRFAPTSSLDWDRDPRLSDLNRVLRSLGWRREGGGVV